MDGHVRLARRCGVHFWVHTNPFCFFRPLLNLFEKLVYVQVSNRLCELRHSLDNLSSLMVEHMLEKTAEED